MKRVFSIIMFSIFICMMTACSEYAVKTELNNSSAISEIKKIGLVLRFSHNSRITKDEQIYNIKSWLYNYKSTENLTFMSDYSENIRYYNSVQNRFYQYSDESFLKYKSIGVINLYLRKNEDELKKIISENNVDGLVIYELYSIIAAELQFVEFESVITIVDKNLNIIFLDHQKDGFENNRIDLDSTKSQLMDKISERLLQCVKGLNLIDSL